MSKVSQWIVTVFPMAKWLSSYTTEDLRGDVVAGLTVGVMLIPQGMAYAVIAGMPPIYGLYAGLVPLVVYPLFGTSRHLATGPTALDMLIVGAGVSAMAQSGTDQYIALAILMAALAGAIQIGMGIAQLGFVANLLSRPVIAGLTASAALIIGFSQLGNFLGIDLSGSQYVHVIIGEAVRRLDEINWPAFAIGAGSIGLIIGIRRWKPMWPDALIVVIAATLVGWLLGVEAEGVEVVGDIPRGLPRFDGPFMGLSTMEALLPAAATLALVQFMKDVSLGRVFAARHSYTINANRELIGIGAGNLVGSFFSAIPASGSFSRTAVNDQAGGRTALTNVFAASVVLLTLIFLTSLFYFLPMPALAAIIMISGFGLIDVDELRELFEAKRRDGFVALFTALCVLFIGIQQGILLGVGATVLLVLYRISRPNVAELGLVPGTRQFRDLERFDQAVRIEDILVLRVDAAFSFANAEYFKEYILDKSEREGRGVRVVVIDGTSINDLDTTAIDALQSTIETLREWGIELHFTGLIGPVREVVRRSGLHDVLGEDHFHMSAHDAVMQVLEDWDADESSDRARRYLAKTDPQHKDATPAAS